MDTGVGSFIISHALVSSEARKGYLQGFRLSAVKKSLVSSSMLLVLGNSVTQV